MSDQRMMLDVWTPRLLSLLRIAVALFFMEHGMQKLFGFPPRAAPGPDFLSLLWFAGVLEFLGGLLVLLGLFTRPLPSCSRVRWRSATSWCTRPGHSSRF